MCYESGIATKEARKNLAVILKDWNPPVTKPEDMICIYFHRLYCTRQGHKDCCSSDCTTKLNTKKEWEAAKKIIAGEAIKKELHRAAKDCGKLWLTLS